MRLASQFLRLALMLPAAAAAHDFPHTEARHTHPAGLTPNGTRLLTLDTIEGRLCVFDITRPEAGEPRLTGEIPVALEPVSLRARTDDEVWVVNELSDSVSIVSLSRRVTVATLSVPDEPADIVFAAGRAFISGARNNTLHVFDAATRAPLGTVTLPGENPRALAASADGQEVYAAYQLSGNNTTCLPASLAPPPPLPSNSALPPAPHTALIVPASDSRVTWTVADHDVSVISAASLAVTRTLSGAGTNLFDIAVHPVSGRLFIPNTEADNLTRFEPALRGRFLAHRLTSLHPVSGQPEVHDLHPGADLNLQPHPALQSTALAQPMSAVFAPDGSTLWVAAFGSDRIARLDPASGSVLARTDLRLPGTTFMRGPRGLALDAPRQRLYVLNKISNTVSVIHSGTGALLAEVPNGAVEAMDPDAQAGRSFLYDARLSGNGLVSCAGCHIDGDRDGIAWDLGDPGGSLLTVMGANLAAHDSTPRARIMHPMKGPMVTQTLRGLERSQRLHWRGDRERLRDFNGTFPALLAAPLLTEAQLISFDTYIHSLKNHPNPFRTLANRLPTSLMGGNPTRGRTLFNTHLHHCNICHSGDSGSDNNVDARELTGSPDHVKTPVLRTTYQRVRFSNTPGSTTVSGFGMGHDGTLPFNTLPIAHPYDLHELATAADFADVRAYVLAFDSGTPPATGRTLTVTAATAAAAATLIDLNTLEDRAILGEIEIAVQGQIGGVNRSFTYFPAFDYYDTDSAAQPTLLREELLALLTGDDVLHFLGMFPATVQIRSIDRNANGIPDFTDRPPPLTLLSGTGPAPVLQWPAASPEWYVESSPALTPPWNPAPLIIQRTATTSSATLLDFPARQFFRLRRTW